MSNRHPPVPHPPSSTAQQIAAFAAAAGAGELRLYSNSPFLVLLAEHPIEHARADALAEVLGALLRQSVEVRPLASVPVWRRTQVWAAAQPFAR